MPPRKKKNYSLALEIIGGRKCDEMEESELHRIFENGEKVETAKMIYLLKRSGESDETISNLMGITMRTYKPVAEIINLSKYLTDRLANSLPLLKPKDTEEIALMADEAIADADIFTDRHSPVIRKKIAQLTLGITPEKIARAPLRDIASAYDIMHKAHRLENGKSTENLSIQNNTGNAKQDEAKKAKIVADLEKLKNYMRGVK